MKIVVSSSMRHADKFADLQRWLEEAGHQVGLPSTEPGLTKRQYIEGHLQALRDSDGLLVANFDDERGSGYIGASCFFEIGWALALNKPVFLLRPINTASPFAEDIQAIGPVVVDQDISKLKGGIDE